MPTFNLYLGGDEFGGQLDRVQVRAVLEAHVDAYTLVDTLGAWKGGQETGYMIVVSFPGVGSYEARKQVARLVANLKATFKQEAVAVQTVPEMEIW